MAIDLISLGIENIRGFRNAIFPFNRSRTLLVGCNNSGKTSILLLLDWILNCAVIPDDGGDYYPSRDEVSLLIPARKTRNKARRLTLRIKVSDKRRYGKLKCDSDGIALLRVDLRINPVKKLILRLGKSSRNEKKQSDSVAIKLLREIQSKYNFIHIPSFRDAASNRFNSSLKNASIDRLSERALAKGQAGTYGEYRLINKSIQKLKKVAEDLTEPLCDEMTSAFPSGFTESAKIRFDCNPEDLVDWMSSRLSLRLSTGEHDRETVKTIDVGSGLQSLLDLALQKNTIGPGKDENARTILAIEEPEAFLHPSAQRVLARDLISGSEDRSIILTTHSPIIVEEAKYGDVVLVKDHRFFPPKRYKDQDREDINSSLLSGYGAQMMFCKSVLLVEGEGDRLFFEGMRRRMAAIDKTGYIERMHVVPVGGNSRFAPWIKLVRSYVNNKDEKTINWIVVCDADSNSEIKECFKNLSIPMPRGAGVNLNEISRIRNMEHVSVKDWIREAGQFNRECKKANFNVRFLMPDLEGSILSQASIGTLTTLKKKIGFGGNKEEFIRHLGSKLYFPHKNDGFKQVWFRGYISEQLKWKDISDEIKGVLSLWMSNAGMKKTYIDRIFGASV